MIAPVSTRLIKTHEPWHPHGYQVRGVRHLIERRAGALFLDPGLGKTAIVLQAFRELKEAGQAERMLVVAPLRVCQLVWRQEGQKWTQFRDLTFSLIHGPKKEERLRDQVDIHLINPEGIAWLSNQFYGRTDLPWEVIAIDELTKFKNARAQRSKRLRKHITRVRYRWGMTGRPAPNGYMDLFGQMLLLDDGAALGRFITYFRDQYFTRNFDGFSYDLQSDGAARIEAKIAPYVLRMSAEDYLELPPLLDNIIEIELPAAAKKQYNEMKKEMILSLPEGVVTAANSAAVYTKLAQLANGAVYVNTDTYAVVHDAKLDALEDLIEELSGQPLLVGYEFQHDLARLQERFPNTPTLTGKSEKQVVPIEAAWNRGEIPLLFAHPASAGHGLNLQGAGASHICWFSRPWDLDLYDQFIRRLLRQGTTAQRIMNHVLVVKDSIDEIKGEALRDKDVTQNRLLRALNAEIIRDDPAQPTGEEMGLKKLGFKGPETEGGNTAPAQESASVKPRGWGSSPEAAPAETQPVTAATETPARPRGWGAASSEQDPQREEISGKLRAPEPDPDDGDDEGPPPAQRALAAFGGDIVQQLTGSEKPPAPDDAVAAHEAAKTPPRGWGTAAPAEPEKAPEPEKPTKQPSRSRRSAAKADEPAQTQPENTAVQREATTPAAQLAGAGKVYDIAPPVRLDFAGLPRRAIAVALAAIAVEMAAE